LTRGARIDPHRSTILAAAPPRQSGLFPDREPTVGH
jgi:hypothetical protein